MSNAYGSSKNGRAIGLGVPRRAVAGLTVLAIASLPACGSVPPESAGSPNETVVAPVEDNGAREASYKASTAEAFGKERNVGSLIDTPSADVRELILTSKVVTQGTVSGSAEVQEVSAADVGVQEFSGGGEKGESSDAVALSLGILVIPGKTDSAEGVTISYFLGALPSKDRIEKLVSLAPPEGTKFIAAGESVSQFSSSEIDVPSNNGLVFEVDGGATAIVATDGSTKILAERESFDALANEAAS